MKTVFVTFYPGFDEYSYPQGAYDSFEAAKESNDKIICEMQMNSQKIVRLWFRDPDNEYIEQDDVSDALYDA